MKNTNLICFILASVIMLLWESILQSVANYSFSELISFIHPILVFGGLALGNVLGLTLIKQVPKSDWSVYLLLSIGLSWMGMCHLSQLGLFWLVLPFIPLGALFYDFFSTLKLKALIISLSIIGVLYFSFLSSTGSTTNDRLFSFLVVFAAALSIILNFQLKKISLIVCIALTPLLIKNLGYLNLLSHMERNKSSFEGAVSIGEPEINLLFRTEILWLPNMGKPILLYNGSRFAALQNPNQKENYLFTSNESKLWPVYVAPYLLKTNPKNVLVIGPAEGANVMAAVSEDSVKRVVAVDINPAVFSFLKDKYPELANNIYNHAKVHTVRAEGRMFLEQNTEKFDLITLQGVQTGTQSSSLSSALLESYLLTEEALDRIWDNLSPNGIVYIDEYSSRYNEEKSIVEIIANLAKKRFNLSDSQIVYYSYTIASPKNTNLINLGKMREGLMLSKQPIADIQAARNRLSEYKINGLTHLNLDNNISSYLKLPKDDHPFFIQNIGNTINFFVLVIVFIFLAGGSLYLLNRSSHRFKGVNRGLFFLGAAYIILIMAFSGPLTLISGEPFLSGILIYIALYVFGLVAGLITLKINRLSYGVLIGISILTLIATWATMLLLKNYFLVSGSQFLRLGFIILAMAIVAIIFEIPYIYYLKTVNGRERGALYTYENLGTLFGALVCLPSQIILGFTGTFIMGILMLFVTWVYLRKE
jgi:hypothetical protein